MTVALFFGGPSAESDVSILTALGAMAALRSLGIDIVPVYLHPEGPWYTDPSLLSKKTFSKIDQFAQTLPTCSLQSPPLSKEPLLRVRAKGIMGRMKSFLVSHSHIPFDVALLACHGQIGEDGALAGLFELNEIPYTCMRHGDSSLAMQKSLSKVLALHGLSKNHSLAKVLPWTTVRAPRSSKFHDKEALAKQLNEANLRFPLCVKPQHLGSSIGVAKADNIDQLQARLSEIFMMDHQAICEPYISNKREFNIAVAKLFREEKITFSLIEEPLNQAQDLLDFDKKYRSGDKSKSGGLADARRVIDPDIDEALKRCIIQSTEAIFNSFDQPSGIPRLDFIYDNDSKELYFNEINPCPGSFGHYLWKGHPQLGTYGKVMLHLLEEALYLQKNSLLRNLQVPLSAQIFPKKRLY